MSSNYENVRKYNMYNISINMIKYTALMLEMTIHI